MSIAAGGILSALHMREVIRHHFIGVLPELCAAGGGHRAPFSDCSSGELRPRRVPRWKPCEVRASSPESTQMKAKILRHFCLKFVFLCLKTVLLFEYMYAASLVVGTVL